MANAVTEDFRSIVINQTPLLDVRAPIEFQKGAFPNAYNIPILTDKERELVGIEYKRAGNSAAVALARELIKEEGKAKRVQAWKSFLQEHPNALLYCFRGGQRSAIAQAWLKEAGIEIVRLKGGYKAFRNFLIEESLRISQELQTIIIGGRTGSNKTKLIQSFTNSIDLEKIAKHRGSSFGKLLEEQPSQINFENTLVYELITAKAKGYKTILLEHEGQNIGKNFIPKELYNNLMSGKLVVLHQKIEKRVENIFCDYIVKALKEYEKAFKEEALDKWANDVLKSLAKIQKRVGLKRYKEYQELFVTALHKHQTSGDLELYKEFIERLLVEYYDPMYDYQLEKTKIPIVFEGSVKEVSEYLLTAFSI